MDDHIHIIIAKSLDGEASEEERAELEGWLAADPRNLATYEDMKVVWGQSDLLFQSPAFDTEAAWEKVSARTVQAGQASPKKTIDLSGWMRYSIAAAAVLLIGFFVLTKYEHRTIEVAALEGNKHIELPDHSTVDIKKGSTLKYPASFAGNERAVELNGQGYFDIVHNEKQPFVVNAQAANIKVLGTSFMVDCDGGHAAVSVTSGSVQLTSRSRAGKALVLKKGERGVLEHGELSKQAITDENFLYWKTGAINFTGEPLEKVVSEIGRLTGNDVSLSPGMEAARKQQLVSISFHDQPIEAMLTDLCLITDCQWSKDTNGYLIRAK